MSKLFTICFVLFCLVGRAQITGRVFIDINSNGIQDRGERGIIDAVVSDGYHVVKTNRKGEFELPGWEKQRFVTLYPGAEFNCENRFIRINPDIQDYKFAVQSKTRKKQVDFIQVSDTETFEHRNWVDDLKEYAQVHQPDFIIHTGDICYETGMKWHAENLTTSKVGVPVYYCLGNHDLIKGEYGEQYFENCFGPAWYAFEEGNTLYVITPMMGGDYRPGFTHKDIGGWLKNLFKVYGSNQPKVFFNHDLLTEKKDFVFKVSKDESINLTDYGLKAWLYGHWHINRVKEHGENGVVSYGTATAVMGGIDHAPSSFRVVHVDDKGNTTSHLRWTYLNKELEITAPQKDIALEDENGNVRIAVNTYHSGSEIDSVKYAVWGKEGYNWKSSLQAETWKKMIQQSDWNWSASFEPFDQKEYTLVIDAFMKSGDVLHIKKKFSVEKSYTLNEKHTTWANLAGNKEHDPVVKGGHEMPYQLRWSANIGTNIFMSSPVLYNDRVITAGFDDGNASGCIICFDKNTGKKVWQYNTKNGIKNQMIIAKGLVVGTDVIGITYAIDIDSGELRWERDLEYSRLAGFVSGIVTDGEVVYTGFGTSLCALKVESGDIIWKNQDWNGGDGTTPIMTIADDVLITSCQWRAVYAHDISSGKVIWSRSDEGFRFRDGVLGYKDGALWCLGRGTKGVSKGNIFQLDLKTGKTIRRIPTDAQQSGTSTPIVMEDQIIAASADPGIAAYDRESGKKIWQYEVGDALFYTPSYFCDRQQSIETTPVLIDDKVVFGAMDGCLYVLDQATGRLLWKTELGAPIMTSIAVSEHAIYVCDFAGNIYCYQEN
ncbi:hypothetical protein EYV94_07755 [Puteibacter caeruleilacunae]|nr:hypothetical protein EYV94_07755 [Puteibacter caeruleilacunae]